MRKITKVKAKAKMQSAYNRNMDQRYYYRNQPVHDSLKKANNSKNSKTKKLKPKDQEPKSLNNFSKTMKTLTRLKRRRRNIASRRNTIKITPMLVFLILLPIELIQ